MASAPAAKPASRWTVIVASAVTIALTSGAGYVTSAWLADRQTVRSEQISQVNRFLLATEAFEPLVRAHMGKILKGEPTGETQESLLANIQLQHVLLDTVRAYVPIDKRSDSDRYAEVLEKLGPAVYRSQDVLTSGPLMQQVNDAIVAKRRLASALRRGAGLPA